MNKRDSLATLLARGLSESRWEKAALLERCANVVGKTNRWFGPFISRVLTRFPGPARPRIATIKDFILSDAGFCRARLDQALMKLPVSSDAEMHSALPVGIDCPPLCDIKQVADWLSVRTSELDWFADLKCFAHHSQTEKLCHYRYRVLAKPGGMARLIESPKRRLKVIQRHILKQLLDAVAPHDAAHGFRCGRSITTFVAPHVGQAVVARMDLTDFFPSITRPRVAALFRTIGYPEKVARVLAGLCTTSTPPRIWDNCDAALSKEPICSVRWLYGVPHLPQGAPTSPALANLSAYRLDCRLFALARSAGANYTRYADDLAFSGDADFAHRAKRFLVHVAATVAEEGFVVHHRKTRIMREGVRQHLAGVVVNRRINIRRSDYDRLKAILENCRRQGAASQNRHSHPHFLAHLSGRVAFVEQLHPERGRRLREMLKALPEQPA
jgi:RNA-directed DNA polymerase